MLYENLKEYLPATLTFEDFMSSHEDKQLGVLQSSKVGPTIADDLKYDSMKAVLGALAVMFLYPHQFQKMAVLIRSGCRIGSKRNYRIRGLFCYVFDYAFQYGT